MKKDVKQVLVSGSWYIVGNFLIKAITFLSVSVFTRIMTVEDYGLYYTYLVYESMLTAIMSLGLAKTITVAKFEFTDSFHDYVASLAGYQTVLAAGVGVAGILVCRAADLQTGMFAAAWIASYMSSWLTHFLSSMQACSIIEIMAYPPPKVNNPIFAKVRNRSSKMLISGPLFL